jgi:hypothetical protein
MRTLYIERRTLYGQRSLSRDIAKHLYMRSLEGNAAVVAEQPDKLLAVVRKQWVGLSAWVQRGRSSTLNALRIQELTNELSHLQRLHFVAGLPNEHPTANVYFATLAAFCEAPPNCQTLYVTQPIDSDTLRTLTRNMPRHALLVLY